MNIVAPKAEVLVARTIGDAAKLAGEPTIYEVVEASDDSSYQICVSQTLLVHALDQHFDLLKGIIWSGIPSPLKLSDIPM